jgi:hypothetical protein
MGVVPRSEAEHYERFGFQHAEIGVFVGIGFCYKILRRAKSNDKTSGQFANGFSG